MLFPTFTFAVFFAVVLPLGWALRGRATAWKILILTASAVFYGYWDWRFLGLLALMILVNEVAAVAVHRQPEPVRRKRLTGTAVVFDLAVLGVFKYYGFFVSSLEDSSPSRRSAMSSMSIARRQPRRRCSISPCTSHSSPSLSLGRSSGPRSSFRSSGRAGRRTESKQAERHC